MLEKAVVLFSFLSGHLLKVKILCEVAVVVMGVRHTFVATLVYIHHFQALRGKCIYIYVYVYMNWEVYSSGKSIRLETV